ncbi:hypothetical protein FRC14_002176 [Serendipita sp. 396]|nr:hypothetical protein FRC14_002176 [Serendipita sp. 396]
MDGVRLTTWEVDLTATFAFGSSNLTFTLEPGWHFVNTEDWRSDMTGSWVPDVGADQGKRAIF